MKSEQEITEDDVHAMLGVTPVSLSLYVQAVTHKSAVDDRLHSFERLEFLGDRVVNMSASRFLLERYRSSDEGFLTQMVARMVSTDTLSSAARALNVSRFVKMDERGFTHGFNHSRKVLADVFEALVCAVYYDRGFPHARDAYLRSVLSVHPLNELEQQVNHKQVLSNCLQSKGTHLGKQDEGRNSVSYVCESSGSGKAGFVCKVHLNGKIIAEGFGESKKAAESSAARRATRALRLTDG